MVFEAGSLREIDTVFADFICRLAGAECELLKVVAVELSRAVGEGHTCLDLAELVGEGGVADAAEELLGTGVVRMAGERAPLIMDRAQRVYLFRYWCYERMLAAALCAKAGERISPVDRTAIRNALKRLFGEQERVGPDWQMAAAAAALWSRLCVISGGPGTGKTSTVVKIIALLLEQHGNEGVRIALAAPTGKAAARLREAIRGATSRLAAPASIVERIPGEVSTIHRLLGGMPGTGRFRYNRDNPLPYDLVVVDEASMVALPLMAKLVDALPRGGGLILLGDRDQLASVEPGAVLGDICPTTKPAGFSSGFRSYLADVAGFVPDEEKFPGDIPPLADSLIILQESYRFGTDSGIGIISRTVNEGDGEAVLKALASVTDGSVYHREIVGVDTLEAALDEAVVKGYRHYLELRDPAAALAAFDRFRVLCAIREGRYGVAGLNRTIERILAAHGLISPDGSWYRGRPVMITVNDYSLRLFNGDIGITVTDPDQPGQLVVCFPEEGGGVRGISPQRLPNHETVYAMTVHKSQGSEFDRVVLVLPPADCPVLTRELIYTGITRAREAVELWCGEDLLKTAVSRRVERRSGLRQALWGPAESSSE